MGWVRAIFLLFCLVCQGMLFHPSADGGPNRNRDDVEPPAGDARFPITISGRRAVNWKQGAYQVWVIEDFRLQQGDITANAPEAVLWIANEDPYSGRSLKVIAYLDAIGRAGPVVLNYGRGGPAHRISNKNAQTIEDVSWLGRFYSDVGVETNIRFVETPGEMPPAAQPAVFHRGMAARRPKAAPPSSRSTSGGVQKVQFQAPVIPPPTSPPSLPSSPSGPAGRDSIEMIPPGAASPGPLPLEMQSDPMEIGSLQTASPSRSVTVRSRSNVRMQAEIFPSADGLETIAVVTSGVNILIRGMENIGAIQRIGVVDIETDRVVIWTSRLSEADLTSGEFQSGDSPIEFYLEGNIVFRQGDRIIYADRMYYNVNQEFGVILSAEALTPVDSYQGLVRLKADVLQQINRENFLAYGAALTTSRLGVPQYWFQAETITFQDRQLPLTTPFSNEPVLDPQTGAPAVEHQLQATSRNNFLYAFGYPIFYWPVMATDLTKPSYFIDRISVKNDNVFGFQVLTTFDMYHLLGLENLPEGTDWDLSLDLLSKRGLGVGSRFQYNRQDLFGYPGAARGFLDAWGIHDNGVDNLGFGRRAVPVEEKFRGRILGRHRQQLSDTLQLSAELGIISDRNFLEEYYELEWDTFKDESTDVELKNLVENQSWNLYAQVRLNDFFTTTEWLPRVDHFILGQDLFDRLSWNAHTHAGLARLLAASEPTNLVDRPFFDLLPWEAERQGIRAGTRQELELPLNLGPTTFTPYVLGDVTHWGEDLAGNDVTRLYGQVGLRTSTPFWRAFPDVRSELLNLNGLAHKVEFTSDFFWAEANRDLSIFPLYDPLDDDAQEAFQRRFAFTTFGGAMGADIPRPFDPRYYALRTGMQQWVSAPSLEIADDLTLSRIGLRQRLQTKRGFPGQERIIDWVELNIQGTYFPRADRDNFGESVGLLDYDFQWRVGDRFTLLSDGFFDFFKDGLRTVSVGGLLHRPGRGRIYLGWRSLEGVFSSSIVNSSVSYRMSEKWIATAGTSIDLQRAGNIGQRLSFTRIGESLLLRFGFNYDRSRDNFGVTLAVEPRLFPSSRLGNVGGVRILPPGAEGLE